jgi:hypothetical protein
VTAADDCLKDDAFQAVGSRLVEDLADSPRGQTGFVDVRGGFVSVGVSFVAVRSDAHDAETASRDASGPPGGASSAPRCVRTAPDLDDAAFVDAAGALDADDTATGRDDADAYADDAAPAEE